MVAVGAGVVVDEEVDTGMVVVADTGVGTGVVAEMDVEVGIDWSRAVDIASVVALAWWLVDWLAV